MPVAGELADPQREERDKKGPGRFQGLASMDLAGPLSSHGLVTWTNTSPFFVLRLFKLDFCHLQQESYLMSSPWLLL
jgi:hypothetical protein